MQAIILAAGRGSRMGELSKQIPKPMIVVAGKTLLQHKIEALPPEVNEIVIIVGHLSGYITSHFGSEYQGRKITFVEQNELLGTAAALFMAKDLVKGRFISMMGD